MANFMPFRLLGSVLSLCLTDSVIACPLMFSMAATAKGIRLLDIVKRVGVRDLAEPKLTGKWEHQLSQVQHGKLSREVVLGRLAEFTREDIAQRNDNLDLAWLKDEGAHDESTLGEPDEIAAEIRVELEGALEDLAALEDLLAPPTAEAAE